MRAKRHFIIDFDSTFTQVEALDVLGQISLAEDPARQEKLAEIKVITDRGMDGHIPFRQSLERRLTLLSAHRNHLPALVERLKENVSVSVKRNAEFFRTHADSVYVVSSGFREFIEPVVTEYGVKADNVYANTFEFDAEGNIVGFDRHNVLSGDRGKVEQVRALRLDGDVAVIGDGYTDLEIKEAGLAKTFFAFTENVTRESVVAKADHIAPSLDEVLYLTKMNTAISYPKNRITVLLLEGIHPEAARAFKEEGYQVEVRGTAMDEEELGAAVQNVSILGIRSKTRITAKVLASANRLIAVGAFCIGTNQIDLDGCVKKGVAVFNAPYSNTRSVVELTIAEIIMLLRNVPDKSKEMHDGLWNKSARGSNEIRGKKLGIVGYGNIGSQLSVLAESMGMEVIYYDLDEKLALGNARKARSLDELLADADVVSLHVDGRPENAGFFGARQFELMKPGAVVLNLSRGNVVDLQALKTSMEEGRVRGAGVDVFPSEPMNNKTYYDSALRGVPNVILTPHIGGSTQEAQENVAGFVPPQIINYVNTGSSMGSVNFPPLRLPELSDAHRLIHLHQNVPGILAQINGALADNKINILGQYLKTNETVGYVITDIDKAYDKQVVKELKRIPHTIRFRVLY